MVSARDTIQIELNNVSKSYGEVVGLAPTDLKVLKGEFFSLLGPSGCGKSTLLKIIAGFEAASTGKVSVGGVEMTGIPPERRRIGFVFQNYALFPHMSVFENVAFGLRARRAHDIDRTVRSALEMVELSYLSSRRPTELSGGQQQRVALARAIAIEPDVLLLDEPLAALDKQLRQTMQRKLVELQRHLGITTIFVTHDQEEALTMSDRVAVMSSEKHSIEQIGTPRDIYRSPRSRMVSMFLGHSNVIQDRVVARDGGGVATTKRGFKFPSDQVLSDENVTFSLRPERITISADAPEIPHECTVNGTISDIVFLGDGQMYYVAVSEDLVLKVRSLDDGSSELTRGQQVWLSWSTDALKEIPSP
jgi:spermidine/putrescine ABC transporter ATP-binding subunit